MKKFILAEKPVIFILVLSLLTMFACTKQVDVEADKEAIAKAGNQMVNALNSDDVDGIMSGLTDDHITMAPNVPAFADMAKLRSWHEERVENFSLNITITTDETEILGDCAFERWSSTLTLTPRLGGEPVQNKTKGIWIWKRQTDGTWKLARSIWNSDLLVPDSK